MKQLVLIPSYNTGAVLLDTVRAARAAWSPVWVVLDGSTDGSAAALAALAPDPALRVLVLPENRGKGGAVLHGLREAAAAGFTHVLTMDADGQHPADHIARFMAASAAAPDAMILGVPVFAADAPALRVGGRRISNAWADLETLWAGIGRFAVRLPRLPGEAAARRDAAAPLDAPLRFRSGGGGAALLARRRPVNLAAPVRYLRPEEGGVTHFRYGRDNVLLTWMHVRLMLGFLARLPLLALRRVRPAATSA